MFLRQCHPFSVIWMTRESSYESSNRSPIKLLNKPVVSRAVVSRAMTDTIALLICVAVLCEAHRECLIPC